MKMRDSPSRAIHTNVDYIDPSLARHRLPPLGGYRPAARVPIEKKEMQDQVQVTVTIEGPVGCGKSGIALILETALKAQGIDVRWVGGEQEKNSVHLVDINEVLQRCSPKVLIVEQTQLARVTTWEERMADVQRRLEERGMRDIKLTFRDGIREVPLDSLNESVVRFLESYLDGHRKVVTKIEFDPESEPEPYQSKS